jgi:hypothetical protein
MNGWGSEDIGGKPPKLPGWALWLIAALLVAVFAACMWKRFA